MDSQRQTISNVVLILSLAIIGYLVKSDDSTLIKFLPLVLMLLGSYGIFVVAKMYERYKYYKSRANAALEALTAAEPTEEMSVFEILDNADRDHSAEYPQRVRIKVYMLWYVIHLVIILVGAIFAGVQLIR